MPSAAFKKSLDQDLPVLFVNIGWAIRYDGTETIRGGHKYIREHPGAAVGESGAFVARRGGVFQCGIGIGEGPSPLHIVFVARDPGDQTIKVVGVYAAAKIVVQRHNWAVARTTLAERLPVERRQQIVGWPPGQGMRRWAKGGKVDHGRLFDFFQRLARDIDRGQLPQIKMGVAEDEQGHEGQLKTLLVRHRKRENKLRRKKIDYVMSKNGGRLKCEVPNCNFDFHKTYGELGAGFAEVHHKRPLSTAPRRGQSVQLSELAVVCANCHRMIHRNGQCRPLEGLIPD